MAVAGAAPARREEAEVPPALRGLVSRLLRAGLGLGCALLAIGLVGYAAAGEGLGPAGSAVGLPEGFGAALAGAAPGAFVLAGVLVLLVTPLLRVGLSVALFASAGDRPFTALTLFVLLLLAATLAVGVIR